MLTPDELDGLPPDGGPGYNRLVFQKSTFFAATYVPKESMHGRTGMLELIPRVLDGAVLRLLGVR